MQNESRNIIADRIISVLTVYPVLNVSMLQIAIGSSIPKVLWEPALQELISAGKVIKDTVSIENPHGRTRTVPTLKLSE